MIKITAEDLLAIEKVINDRNVNVFVGASQSGEMFLQADYKDQHYIEVLDFSTCMNEPKALVIDRFAQMH